MGMCATAKIVKGILLHRTERIDLDKALEEILGFHDTSGCWTQNGDYVHPEGLKRHETYTKYTALRDEYHKKVKDFLGDADLFYFGVGGEGFDSILFGHCLQTLDWGPEPLVTNWDVPMDQEQLTQVLMRILEVDVKRNFDEPLKEMLKIWEPTYGVWIGASYD